MDSKHCLKLAPANNVVSITENQSAEIYIDLQPGKGDDMLILTRRIGEKLMVGGNVSVTVLSAKGNQISLGIEAPREIKIHREEVFNKIQSEKKTPVAIKSKKPTVQAEKDAPTTKNRETLGLKRRKKIIGL